MKKFLLIVGGFFAFLLILVALLPFLISVDTLKEKALTKANEQINGTIELTSLRLSIYPWLGLKAGGLTVKNGKAFQESDLLRVEDAGIRVRLLPLLKDRQIRGEIVIVRPHIRMETLADGTTSISALMKKNAPKEAPPTPAASEGTSSIVDTMVIESLSIENGEVISVKQGSKGSTETQFHLRHVDLRMKDLAFVGQIPVTFGAAVFQSEDKDVKFEGIVEANLAATAKPKSLKINSSTLTVGNIPLRIEGPVLLPERKPADLDLTIRGEGISLGRLEKDLPLVRGKMPKGLEGDLAFTVGAKGPTEPSDALAISFSFFSNRLALQSGQNIQLTSTKLDGTLRGDSVRLKELSTQAYGGTFRTEGTIGLKGPSIALTAAARNLDVQQLANGFSSSKDLLYGTAELDMEVSGTPTTPAPGSPASLVPAWIQSKGKLAVKNGKIASWNLMGALTQTLLTFAPISDDARKALREQNFDLFSANFRTDSGTVILEPVTVTYPAGGANLAGQIAADQTLAFQGKLELDKRTGDLLGASFLSLRNDKGRMVVPFKVTGTVEKPSTAIQMGSIVKNAVKNEIEKFIPPETKGLVTDLLKPLAPKPTAQ